MRLLVRSSQKNTETSESFSSRNQTPGVVGSTAIATGKPKPVGRVIGLVTVRTCVSTAVRVSVRTPVRPVEMALFPVGPHAANAAASTPITMSTRNGPARPLLYAFRLARIIDRPYAHMFGSTMCTVVPRGP